MSYAKLKAELKRLEAKLSKYEIIKDKNGRRIGEVYSEGDLWGYNSDRMERKSEGSSSHWGVETRT